jgi:hypothetical protein
MDGFEDDDVYIVNFLDQEHNILEDDDHLIPIVITSSQIERAPSLFRKRWQSAYLVDLAQREGSFLAEYRVDAGGFDILHQLLDPILSVNKTKAANAMGKSLS